MEAKAYVFIPKVKNKGTEVVLDIHPLVLCKDCDKAKVLKNHVICCNPRNTECQTYPLDWFCADGEEQGVS